MKPDACWREIIAHILSQIRAELEQSESLNNLQITNFPSGSNSLAGGSNKPWQKYTLEEELENFP